MIVFKLKFLLDPFPTSKIFPKEVTSTSIALEWETPVGVVDFYEVTLVPSHGEVYCVFCTMFLA